MFNPLIVGAAAGVLGDEAGERLDQMRGKPAHALLGSTLHGDIIEIRKNLDIIAKHYQQLGESPIDTIAVLQVDPLRYRLDTKGRKYNAIFVPNGTTSISANIPGLGVYTFTAATGWTTLDFRQGTELFLSTGNPQNIIVRVSNHSLGSNLI